MQKRMTTTYLVIAAFAVVPSFASANPILTEPTGTPLAAGAKIAATNVGHTIMKTSTGELTCTASSWTGEVTSNVTAAGVTVDITAMSSTGTGPEVGGEKECTGSGFFTPGSSYKWTSLPWCLSAPSNANVFSVRGGACTEAQRAIKFDWVVTGVGACEYSRAIVVNGTLVTDGGGANENTLAITEQAWTKIGGPGLCPAEVKLTMRFSLETDPPGSGQIFLSP